MASVTLNQAISAEYRDLCQTLEIKPDRFAKVDAIVDKIIDKKSEYVSVSGRVNAPWFFVGAMHNMESSPRFDRQLHNGDPLSDRTKQVPAGQPAGIWRTIVIGLPR